MFFMCVDCWLQGGLWALGDTQVLAAPGELRVHKYTFRAHLLVFRSKRFAWLQRDGGRMVIPYYSDFVNVSDFMDV